MFMQVDPSSSVPVYAQIVDQVKNAVASGLLIAGDKLPSIRALGKELRVNPNTIIRAYKELEGEGVIISKRGQGNFVTERESSLTEEVKCEMISKTIDRLLTEAYHLQLSDDKVLELIKLKMLRLSKETEGKEK
jgi:GntR family transcriptional regulator